MGVQVPLSAPDKTKQSMRRSEMGGVTIRWMSAKETLKASSQLCLSFTKRDRDLSDYPTVIRKQREFDSEPSATKARSSSLFGSKCELVGDDWTWKHG